MVSVFVLRARSLTRLERTPSFGMTWVIGGGCEGRNAGVLRLAQDDIRGLGSRAAGEECPGRMGAGCALGQEILGLLWTGRPRRLKPDHI